MDCNQFIVCLGEATEGETLVALLTQFQRSGAEVSDKEIGEEGFASLAFESSGMELVFRERRAFEAKYAPAKANGRAVPASIVIYPNGTADFRPYSDAIPFGSGCATDRQGVLTQLGSPTFTETDDGVVRWDQWERNSRQIRATYDRKMLIRKISTSVPMKKV